MALVSCLAVLWRRPLGARLAALLLAMVAVTAAVVLLDLPPSRAEFRTYLVAETAQTRLQCSASDPGCVATDHASEIRINYSLGALALSGFYLWAVSGWTPRRRDRRRRAIA